MKGLILMQGEDKQFSPVMVWAFRGYTIQRKVMSSVNASYYSRTKPVWSVYDEHFKSAVYLPGEVKRHEASIAKWVEKNLIKSI